MAKRRGDREGSIFKRSDGRWCAQVSLGPNSGGAPRRKSVYGKTRLEVSEALKRILRDQQLGKPPLLERQTVANFLSDWLENNVKPKNKQLTYRSYEWIVRTHLIPHLGRLPLVKLTPQILQGFINERHATGLSAATVKHINATLRAALSQAQRWQLVHQNAAKLITLPRSIRYAATILEPPQANALLKHIDDHPQAALFTIALTMGLRRGEMLGLRWQDVNLEGISRSPSFTGASKGQRVASCRTQKCAGQASSFNTAGLYGSPSEAPRAAGCSAKLGWFQLARSRFCIYKPDRDTPAA